MDTITTRYKVTEEDRARARRQSFGFEPLPSMSLSGLDDLAKTGEAFRAFFGPPQSAAEAAAKVSWGMSGYGAIFGKGER